MFPPNGLITRRPASLPRVLDGASSPASTVLPERYDFLPPVSPRFVSFAWRYHPSARVSPAHGRALPWAGLLELVTRYLRPGDWSVETTGSPTFLGNPDCALALLSDPGRTNASGHTMRRRGPRCVHDEGSRIRTFEAQSHGFGTGCLRFAGRVTPTPRKTRFRLLARLFRTGLITRRVPPKGFTMYATPVKVRFHPGKYEVSVFCVPRTDAPASTASRRRDRVYSITR